MDGACEQPIPAMIRATVTSFLRRYSRKMAYGLLRSPCSLTKRKNSSRGIPRMEAPISRRSTPRGRAEFGEEVDAHTGIHEALPVASKEQVQFGLGQVVVSVVGFRVCPARFSINGLSQTIQEPAHFIDTHVSPPDFLCV